MLTPGEPPQLDGGSGQDEAAFDEPDPLDEDPAELDELAELDEVAELDEDDPESLEADEDEADDDSDFPAFTVLLVEVLRESVR